MKDPYILITDQKISSVSGHHACSRAVQRAGRGLLIIAEDIDGEALPTLVLNKIRGALSVCAVKAPATAIAASASSRTSPSLPVARPLWTSWA